MFRHGIGSWVAWAAAGVLAPVSLWAAEPKALKKADPACETVEIFAGIESGRIAVEIIPRDAHHCRLLITNKTEQALNVRLPEVLAAVPVAAQFADAMNQQQPGGGASQRLGLPIQQGPGNNAWNNPLNNNRGPQFNPGQMPLFNIAPEKTGQLPIASLCLDFGKPTPRPAIPYRLQPIEQVSDRAELAEVLRMAARGALGEGAAQAAAWHVNNGLTWEKLASLKENPRALAGKSRFTAAELAGARKAVEQAQKRAARPGDGSGGKT